MIRVHRDSRIDIKALVDESVAQVSVVFDDCAVVTTLTADELDDLIDRLMIAYQVIAPQGRPVCDRVEKAHG